MASKSKKTKVVSELEALKKLSETPAEKSDSKTEQKEKTSEVKKVKILKLICRPEGTFLPNRIYALDSVLAENFIKTKRAEAAE